jgi:methionine synthase II (cobalamin-independent)
VTRCVEAVTKRQADLGLDVVSDGEMLLASRGPE